MSDDWKHLSDTTRRAGKQHICYLCGLAIKAGQIHLHRVGVCDGAICHMRMHESCADLTKLWGEEEWSCHEPVMFREQLSELKAAAGGGA